MMLDRRMNRRDFLKYSLAGSLLLGLGAVGIKVDNRETPSSSYGNGVYGGKK